MDGKESCDRLTAKGHMAIVHKNYDYGSLAPLLLQELLAIGHHL